MRPKKYVSTFAAFALKNNVIGLSTFPSLKTPGLNLRTLLEFIENNQRLVVKIEEAKKAFINSIGPTKDSFSDLLYKTSVALSKLVEHKDPPELKTYMNQITVFLLNELILIHSSDSIYSYLRTITKLATEMYLVDHDLNCVTWGCLRKSIRQYFDTQNTD